MSHKRTKNMPQVAWQCPSNIALVKYWGKQEFQMPVNPSLSFALKNSVTETSIELIPQESKRLYFEFEGRESEFAGRVDKFLDRLVDEIPWVNDYTLKVKSRNTFPHSAGIASSASAFASIALCLIDIDRTLKPDLYEGVNIYNKASSWARLGSGSACRSLYGGFSIWGETRLFESGSNEYAIQISENIHPSFKGLKDAVLIVDSAEKSVSSSEGHSLMKNHVFQKSRIAQAHENLTSLYLALLTGDKQRMMEVAEDEALSLHAMMMTSKPSYILLKPNSLEIINRIRKFREERNVPVFFTIDAGPNIHLLYLLENKPEVQTFIERELVQFCENRKWIDDGIGDGPVKIDFF